MKLYGGELLCDETGRRFRVVRVESDGSAKIEPYPDDFYCNTTGPKRLGDVYHLEQGIYYVYDALSRHDRLIGLSKEPARQPCLWVRNATDKW